MVARMRHALSAAGVGLSGRADQFHVAYRQLVGDGVIVARLASASWGRLAASGVVIRDSLQPGSRTVTLEVTGGGRLRFKQRTSSGGWLATLSETGATMPIWLRR